MLKTVIALTALLGLAAPAFANSAQGDLGSSKPGATQVKKKVEKKEEKKTEEGDKGTTKKEEKTEKTEETKPQG